MHNGNGNLGEKYVERNGGEFIVKHRLIVCIFLLLLTVCFYSVDGYELKNEQEVGTESETAVKEQAKQKYGIYVDVKMEKLGFTFSEGKMFLPIKTDKRLVVPVQTIGNPTYDFLVYFSIYDEDREEYQFAENKLDLRELPKMGTTLLTDIYKELYEKELDGIIEFDESIEMTVTVEDKFSNIYFEDKQEEDALLMDFSRDYNHGKFVDPTQYASLIKKHTELPSENTIIYEELIKGDQPCTPEIHLSIELDESEEQTVEDRLATLLTYIENEDTMPNGSYSISIRKFDPDNPYDEKNAHELVIICED